MEFNLVRYDKRLAEIILKGFKVAFSVAEAKIQVETERSDSTNEILEDVEKKHKEYKGQLEK